MAIDEALKEQSETPSSSDSDAKRERSTIEFPYLDLDDAERIAKGVHEVGGSKCQWEQLAAHLQEPADSSMFRLRVSTAKIFGLVVYNQGIVALTPLGARICDPQQDKAARAEAFLSVPLYRAVYEQFKGSTLPPTAGLESAMVTFGVAPKQKVKARQPFNRSATQAGFFAWGSNRLVFPAIKGSSEATPANGKEEHTNGSEKKKEKEDEGERDPLIEGLIKRLPKTDSAWSPDARRKWLQLAINAFDVIYTGAEEGNSLKIEIEKSSAKIENAR